MTRYIVTMRHEYDEQWIIEADSPEDAQHLRGTILDHDDGAGNDEAQNVRVDETDAEELP